MEFLTFVQDEVTALIDRWEGRRPRASAALADEMHRSRRRGPVAGASLRLLAAPSGRRLCEAVSPPRWGDVPHGPVGPDRPGCGLNQDEPLTPRDVEETAVARHVRKPHSAAALQCLDRAYSPEFASRGAWDRTPRSHVGTIRTNKGPDHAGTRQRDHRWQRDGPVRRSGAGARPPGQPTEATSIDPPARAPIEWQQPEEARSWASIYSRSRTRLRDSKVS
jgi:hypothetical protein